MQELPINLLKSEARVIAYKWSSVNPKIVTISKLLSQPCFTYNNYVLKIPINRYMYKSARALSFTNCRLHYAMQFFVNLSLSVL